MSADPELAKLEAMIDRAKEADRRARKADASRYMRQAAEVLGGGQHSDDAMLRAIVLLVEAADVLIEGCAHSALNSNGEGGRDDYHSTT